MKPDKIDIIVQLPLDAPHEKNIARGWCVIKELLKERDWSKLHEKKKTFKLITDEEALEGLNFVEFKMVLTPDMTQDDLLALALKFSHWMPSEH